MLAAACGLSACGGGHDDLTKRMAAMQSELTRLQNHSDRLEERLAAIEVRKEKSAAPGTRAEAAAPAATVERPRLMVVKLEPGDAARDTPSSDAPTAALSPEDSAADTSPRPMIRVYGSRTDVDSGSDNARRKR